MMITMTITTTMVMLLLMMVISKVVRVRMTMLICASRCATVPIGRSLRAVLVGKALAGAALQWAPRAVGVCGASPAPPRSGGPAVGPPGYWRARSDWPRRALPSPMPLPRGQQPSTSAGPVRAQGLAAEARALTVGATRRPLFAWWPGKSTTMFSLSPTVGTGARLPNRRGRSSPRAARSGALFIALFAFAVSAVTSVATAVFARALVGSTTWMAGHWPCSSHVLFGLVGVVDVVCGARAWLGVQSSR